MTIDHHVYNAPFSVLAYPSILSKKHYELSTKNERFSYYYNSKRMEIKIPPSIVGTNNHTYDGFLSDFPTLQWQ